MPGTITLDHPAFRAALADVQRATERLTADRDRVAHQVDALLDGAWTGAAAASYAEGWDRWKDAAARVLAGLDTMGRLLDGAHADLTRSDLSSDQALAVLAARLG
jgi:WXG100 family type VII secretion target